MQYVYSILQLHAARKTSHVNPISSEKLDREALTKNNGLDAAFPNDWPPNQPTFKTYNEGDLILNVTRSDTDVDPRRDKCSFQAMIDRCITDVRY